jgi:DnaJ family protein A protein 5
MKECYYSVLGVDRKADEDTIKKAYRQMALKNHPDKHEEQNREAATIRFQIISEAYEVLSNKQERAWYDSHRDQILRGDEDGDSCAGGYSTKRDIWRYFSSSCFNGRFDDNDGGFYRTYGDLFEELARLERDDYSVDSEDENVHVYPGFGDSKSEWEDVQAFYASWTNFTSCRHFGSFDKWNIREAENRQIRRAMEAENKKARNIARREYATAVRNLVSFVKRRDKRVVDYQARQAEADREALEQKLEEQKRLEEARRVARALAREEEMKRWEEVEAIRRANGDVVSSSSDTSEDEEFVCVACRKSFKSEKAFQNHENSKKHKQEVEKLRQELWLSDDDVTSPVSPISEQDQVTQGTVKKSKKKKKNVVPLVVVDEDQSDEEIAKFTGQTQEEDELVAPSRTVQRKPRRRRKDGDEQPTVTGHACSVCRFQFLSRSALFRHLDESGHHAPIRK